MLRFEAYLLSFSLLLDLAQILWVSDAKVLL